MLQQILNDMYVDPEILAELSEEQKQLLFCKMREEQIKRWQEREDKIVSESKQQPPKLRKPGCKAVEFLMGADDQPWVWVMGDHPDDISCDRLPEGDEDPSVIEAPTIQLAGSISSPPPKHWTEQRATAVHGQSSGEKQKQGSSGSSVDAEAQLHSAPPETNDQLLLLVQQESEERQRLEEQRLKEQRREEQQLEEQQLEEQRLKEQRLVEQRLVEQRLEEQRLAEQRLVEQRLEERQLAEQQLRQQQQLAEQQQQREQLAEQQQGQQQQQQLAIEEARKQQKEVQLRRQQQERSKAEEEQQLQRLQALRAHDAEEQAAFTREESFREVRAKRPDESRLAFLEKKAKFMQPTPAEVIQLESNWRQQEAKAKAEDERRRSVAREAREEYKRNSLSTKGSRNHRAMLSEVFRESVVLVGTSLTDLESVRSARTTPRPRSAAEAEKWFRDVEKPKRAAMEIKSGMPYEWFHGAIPRAQAEEMLCTRKPHTFLVRLSDKIWGYAISYKAADMCKHYLVDVTDFGYQLFGTNQLEHASLANLIQYHKSRPITTSGQELLMFPCGQDHSGRPDYADLFPDLVECTNL